jgi:hypothetical protein
MTADVSTLDLVRTQDTTLCQLGFVQEHLHELEAQLLALRQELTGREGLHCQVTRLLDQSSRQERARARLWTGVVGLGCLALSALGTSLWQILLRLPR